MFPPRSLVFSSRLLVHSLNFKQTLFHHRLASSSSSSSSSAPSSSSLRSSSRFADPTSPRVLSPNPPSSSASASASVSPSAPPTASAAVGSSDSGASDPSRPTLREVVKTLRQLEDDYVSSLPAVSSPEKSARTPLIDHLLRRIDDFGPLSIHDYMLECLQNPRYGYYMRSQIPFGPEGDFVTSPEICSIFGELIGVFLIQSWIEQGKPKECHIIEFGPGRGTLMRDALRTVKKIAPAMYSGVKNHMIESSPALIQHQISLLQVKLDERKNAESNEKIPKYSPSPASGVDSPPSAPDRVVFGANSDGIPVEWHQSFDSFMLNFTSPHPVFLLCHEFFDALPVYQFLLTKWGWAEMFVDKSLNPEDPHHLRFAFAPEVTPMARTLIPERFQNVHRALHDPLLIHSKSPFQLGTNYEVSPISQALIEQITHFLAERRGLALIIDYGDEPIVPNRVTLQAVKKHKKVSPLQECGEVDLTVHVDFHSLRSAIQATCEQAKYSHIQTYPLLSQREFLRDLGLEMRYNQCLAKCETEEEKERLFGAVMRLVDDTEESSMGNLLKAFVVTSRFNQPPYPFRELQKQKPTAKGVVLRP